MKIPLPKLMRHWREREFERHLTPRDGAAGPGACGRSSRGGRRCTGWRRGSARAALGWLGRKRGRFASLPLAGGWTGGRDLPAPEGETFFARYAKQRAAASGGRESGRARLSASLGADERRSAAGAIRRALRRGAAVGSGCAAARAPGAHPRQLIPARSRVPQPSRSRCSSPMWNGSLARVARVADAGRGAGGGGRIISRAQNLPSEIAIAPHPELREMPWAERPLLRLREGRARRPTWSACSTPSPRSPRPAR